MPQNPWRILPVDVQGDLGGRLVDPVVFGWFGTSSAIPRDVPGACSFNDWYKRFYSTPPVPRRSVFAEWRFNHALTFEQRNSLLCVHAKVKAERLWDLVRTIHWVGATGELLFVSVSSPDAVRQLLSTRGYGDWWLASHKCRWGVRSRFRGAQLHFRGPNDDVARVNVHVDIHNPGDPTEPGARATGAIEELDQALRHLWRDDIHRQGTHTPPLLRAALVSAGLRVPTVP